MRRAGWILLAIAIVVVAVVAALLWIGRSDLSERAEGVDASWAQLREPLTARYLSLGEAAALTREVGGEREVVTEIERALDDWRNSGARADESFDTNAEVALANELEGLARRLDANVRESPRLNTNADLVAAMDALPATLPSEDLITAYDEAVRAYENDRDAMRYRPSAALFGFDERRTFEPAG